MKRENMKKYNFLIILKTPPPFGGGEIRASYLKKYLTPKKEYLIFSYSRKDSNKSTQGKISPRNLYWGFYQIIKIISYITKTRPKIIFTSIPKNLSAFLRTGIVIIVAKSMGVKIIGELAGANFQFLENGRFKKKIGLFFLKRVDLLRVLGKSVKKDLESHGITNTIVLDNGVYVPDEIKISKEDIYSVNLNLLYIGALNYSKGIKNLIKAIHICKDHNLDVHLHVLGEWSNFNHKRKMENYIQYNNLNDYITFHGLLTDNRKWEIIQKCSILTHPTYWDGQPLTILESMGCGLAIISTHVGAIPDTVEDKVNGILLNENSPSNLFQAIHLFYFDRKLLHRISEENIRCFKKKFSVESYCERMGHMFDTFYHENI